MPHSQGSFRKPDAEFLSWAATINTSCHEHPEWGIDISRVYNFDYLLSNAKSTYEANSNRATRNSTTAQYKNAAFGELKHFLGLFINTLEGDTNVPDAALAFMGLRPRTHKGYQPLDVPKETPGMKLERVHDELTVYVSQPAKDHQKETVAPIRYHGFALRYKKEDDPAYQTIISTRLHHTLFFSQEDEKKRIFLSAAWVNPRLQTGPWCEEVSVVMS
ncbi:MAG: hypothetical protein LBN98_01675 [Prevotellaceae bacterium]|jgi:hypothetical protein|nr:hypothetical protein [Prevotellaceae bacterium]